MLRTFIAESQDFSLLALARLKSFSEVELNKNGSGLSKKTFSEYDIVLTRLATRICPEVIGENPRCGILAVPVTGLDHIDLGYCEQKGIKVLSLKGETNFLREVRATAELTIGLTIALLRNIAAAVASVKLGAWERDLFRGQELYHKTVGVLGFGRLGRIVADYYRAFGCEVIKFDLADYDTSSLEAFFPELDVLSIHASLDEKSYNLVNQNNLKFLKKSAILINTARGGLVNSQDLLCALESKSLQGAALDVIAGEPELDEGLIQYARANSNLLITPHIGGNTFESFEKTENFIVGKIEKSIGNYSC